MTIMRTVKTDEKMSYSSTIGNVPLMPFTIGALLSKKAAEEPHKVAYIFQSNDGLELTFSEAKRRADILAHNLLEMGFVKGDRLAIALPNTHELLITYFAAGQIGVVAVPIDIEYGTVEVIHMFKKTTPRGFLVWNSRLSIDIDGWLPELFPEMKSWTRGNIASSQFPSLRHLITLSDPSSSIVTNTYNAAWSYSDLVSKRLNAKEHKLPIIDPDDTFAILFTSGTTSLPKGVIVKHHGILNNSYIFNEIHNDPKFAQITCNPFNTYHIGNILTSLMLSLISGKKTVIPSYFTDREMIFKAIARYRCNTLFVSPKLLHDLLEDSIWTRYDLSSLKYVLSGSQLVPQRLVNKVAAYWGVKNFAILYGMTEIGITHMTDFGEINPASPNAVGRPFPFVECKIVDENSHIVPLDTEGELYTRGYSVTKGYFNDVEQTESTIDENKWLKTGDKFKMDEHGNLHFCSRVKEIIITHDRLEVFPLEVEECLAQHDGVQDVIAFGVDLNDVEQAVCAWVIPNKAADTSAKELRDFCVGKLCAFKIPKFIKLVDAIPMNHIGKYSRKDMKTAYTQELIADKLLKK